MHRSTLNATPAVSVILPTYNRASLVQKAIESVLCQTFVDFELIVVDDGSSDGTGDLLRSFDDDRLICLTQKNLGRSAARNRAIRLARGGLIAFLDSDDLYLPDKLERQVDFMVRHPAISMIYTPATCIDEHGNLLDRQVYSAEAEGDIYRDIAFFQPVTITLPTVMLRRQVLKMVGLFDEKMDRFEDTDMWRRIAKRYRIGVIKSPTCILRTHSDNALQSQDPVKIISAIDYYVSKIRKEDSDVEAAYLRAGASRLYEYYGRAFLSVPGWHRHALLLLRKAAGARPERTPMILAASLRTAVAAVFRRQQAQAR